MGMVGVGNGYYNHLEANGITACTQLLNHPTRDEK